MVKEFGHAVLSKQTLDDVKGVCFAKAKLAYGFCQSLWVLNRLFLKTKSKLLAGMVKGKDTYE